MLSLERKAGEAIRIGHHIAMTVIAVNQDSVKLRVGIKTKTECTSNEVTLTNKPGEHLKLGKSITITLQSIRYNSARIGIQAPSNITIHREEIYAREYSAVV